jgi:hypothetical protein
MFWANINKLVVLRLRSRELSKSRAVRLTSLLVASLTCAGALVVNGYNRGVAPTDSTTNPFEAPSSAQPHSASQGPAARLEGELVTAHPHGFEPNQIRRPSGKFLLAVDNRSGLSELILRLDHVAGARLREVQVPMKKLDWRDLVDLPPGTYRLTEANHSDWSCEITITPQ